MHAFSVWFRHSALYIYFALLQWKLITVSSILHCNDLQVSPYDWEVSHQIWYASIYTTYFLRYRTILMCPKYVYIYIKHTGIDLWYRFPWHGKPDACSDPIYQFEVREITKLPVSWVYDHQCSTRLDSRHEASKKRQRICSRFSAQNHF